MTVFHEIWFVVEGSAHQVLCSACAKHFHAAGHFTVTDSNYFGSVVSIECRRGHRSKVMNGFYTSPPDDVERVEISSQEVKTFGFEQRPLFMPQQLTLFL